MAKSDSMMTQWTMTRMDPKQVVLSATKNSSWMAVMLHINMMYVYPELESRMLMAQVEIILDGDHDEDTDDSGSSDDESMNDTEE